MVDEKLKWEKYPNKGKRRSEAIILYSSIRGLYIISQALTKAIEAMLKEKHPEYSNIEDMQLLLTELFPLFDDIENISKLYKNCFGEGDTK